MKYWKVLKVLKVKFWSRVAVILTYQILDNDIIIITDALICMQHVNAAAGQSEVRVNGFGPTWLHVRIDPVSCFCGVKEQNTSAQSPPEVVSNWTLLVLDVWFFLVLKWAFSESKSCYWLTSASSASCKWITSISCHVRGRSDAAITDIWQTYKTYNGDEKKPRLEKI